MIYKSGCSIKTAYYEANKEESTLLNYQHVNLEQYLQHVLLQRGLLVQKCIQQVNEKSINLVIHYYLLNYVNSFMKTSISKYYVRLKKMSLLKVQKLEIKKKNKLKQRVKLSDFLIRFSLENQPLISTYYKNYLNKIYYKKYNLLEKDNFHEYLLETLFLYTGKKYHISLIFKNLNRGVNLRLTLLEKSFLRKHIILLKVYTKHKYFKDVLNLCVLVSKTPNSSKLISSFLAICLRHMKYHKPFISFVTKLLKIIVFSRSFLLQGIKFIISGRLNNKPRSSNTTVILGNIPTITKNIETIDYSESISYTKNGTFGVKIWCNHLK